MPAEGYWQAIRNLCTVNGIVLAIDDIRCGFLLDLAKRQQAGAMAYRLLRLKQIAVGWGNYFGE